jgi:hypothetical protein
MSMINTAFYEDNGYAFSPRARGYPCGVQKKAAARCECKKHFIFSSGDTNTNCAETHSRLILRSHIYYCLAIVTGT